MYTFPKQKRLLYAHEYEATFNKGKKIFSDFFVFFYCENEFTYPRLGIVISKKKVAKSHERQRIKRLIRESFRCRKLKNVDVIVVARHGIENENNASLLSQLGHVWDDLVSC
ncbi:MAG: ribonuclease P protein component [Legionellales bacterium RIFCSPHIGHO2_12_FULL_37_14]|nr:MAG: ribonuclease P protein component [Legionellales bacterium RIFCSPHIGHO2_12_FULL_37_14]